MSTFTCPVCGKTSYHLKDVEYGYCGHCHEFTGTALGRTIAEKAKELRGVASAAMPNIDDDGHFVTLPNENKVSAQIGTLWTGDPILLVLCRRHLGILSERMGTAPFPFTPYEGTEPCEVCSGARVV